MTTIITGITSDDANTLTEIKNAYEKLAEVPAVWIDVDADITRPVMQRKGYDRARWFDDVLPRCLQGLQGRPGDLDVFVGVKDAAEAARVLELGGLVARLGGVSGAGVDGALDLRQLAPKVVARELVRALG